MFRSDALSRGEQSPFTRIWGMLVILLFTIGAIVAPLRVVLGSDLIPDSSLLDLLLTALFTADIVVNAAESRRAGVPYGRLLLAADILAAIPFHLAGGYSWLLFLRLFKLGRVARAMSVWRGQHLHRWNQLRLVYFVYWLAIAVHWLATGWLSLRGMYPGADRWTLYLRSLYWCISTITTIGYGDITPANNAQIVYAIVVMIFGVGMYGYVIANISTIIGNLQPARTRYLANMEKLGAFMRSRDLPPAMQRRIRDYYGYVWEHRLGYDEASIVQGLPPGLLVEVSLFLKRDIIQKVPFFKGAGDDLIREIALVMQPVVYTPGDLVFGAGEPGEDMYFISRGHCEVTSADGRTIVATLREGDFFGEIALLEHRPRSASVRAATYCDLYRLDKESFERVIAKFPEFAAHIGAKSAGRRQQPVPGAGRRAAAR
ncbi:MAG TPA: cyclic nucleotide-binding domain-containing protein [Bacteroidota bacterium]|nr:cyclic nucleotide-binding domain-containing protein [Bacteroidota bacterium]